jgi:hypothetical protein
MARKKITAASLKETPQTNGALTPPRSIYEIIGKDTFPYAEKTLQEYQKKLEKLDFADLQTHAVAVANILPNIDKRERLIDKLEREYLKRQFAFVGSEGHYQNPATTPEITEILRRGR